MRIDDHLPERIVSPHRLVGIGADRSKEVEDHRNSLRVNAIFGFFQAQQTVRVRIQFDHGQRQESERTVREGSCRVCRAVAPGDGQSQ